MNRAQCYDCGREYGDEFGFPDLVIPDWAWRSISPKGNEGGLLCPSCICERLYKADIYACPSAFDPETRKRWKFVGWFFFLPQFRRVTLTSPLCASCGLTKRAGTHKRQYSHD